MTLIGDNILDSCGPRLYLVLIVLANLLLCVVAYRKRWLSFTGNLMTMIVGCCAFFFLSLSGWMLLIVFFVTSTFIGRYIRSKKCDVRSDLQKKGGCRDHAQVFANGGPATLCALLYGLTGNNIFIVLFGAAIAESNSDTWAGEIGLLSKEAPFMITTMEPCERGISGGVTILGFIGGALGSICIGISWAIAFRNVPELPILSNAIIISITGFLGCVVDSLLGASFQGLYRDPVTSKTTEHSVRNGRKMELISGYEWMDNDMVNLLSNLSSILLGATLILV